MKLNLSILSILCACAILSCSDSSKDKTYDFFNIQPGMVTPFSSTISGTSFNVSFGGNPYNPPATEAYAIIISNVNNTGNVGIAFGTNPKSNRSFKVFIYFNGDISNGNKSGTATVIENGARYSGTFTNKNFTFAENPVGSNYYDITIENIIIDSKTLTITSLKAYLVQ